METSAQTPIDPQADIFAPPVTTQPCGLATGSLVCGILGLFTCLPGIPAVILGHIALARIRRSGGMLTGKGRAVVGLAMGYLAVTLLVSLLAFWILAVMTFPNFTHAYERSQASTVLNEAHQLDAAKDVYAMDHEKRSEVTPTFGDLTPYLKAQSRLVLNGGQDCLGNPFILGPIGTPVRINPKTKEALRPFIGGDKFWGPFS